MYTIPGEGGPLRFELDLCVFDLGREVDGPASMASSETSAGGESLLVGCDFDDGMLMVTGCRATWA